VIGIAIVLSAVFIPTAFVPGITGRLYQQFAVTIAVSVLISAFNALSLSPALAALLLRPKKQSRGILGRFFAWFNRWFNRATDGYVKGCAVLIHKFAFSLILLLGFGALAVWLGGKLPGGFLPDEDQGYIFAALQLPDAASLQRSEAAAAQVEEILKQSPGVAHVTTVVGFNMLSGVQNTYSAFFWVTLKEWAERKAPEEQYSAIKAHISSLVGRLPQGVAFVFPPPAIPGVGAAGGFTFILEDRSGKDVKFLTQNMDTFLAAARKRPELTGVFSLALPNVPQLFAKVDRDKALKQGVNLGEVYQTLQAFMGGALVNYFNRFGRQWQVFVQAEGDYRTKAQNVGEFQVRNSLGEMVPMSALTSIENQIGPEFTMRYNLYRSVQINGSAAPGYSSNDAMKALEEVFAQTMPSDMGFDYLGMSFQENLARKGVPSSVIFAISVLFVFLILAALYESWSLPFSVLLSTPIAIFGALGTLYLRRMNSLSFEMNVYAQIGLVMLIGLAAKNAILIVEFAKAGYDSGKPLADAALEGAKVRLRPILMTSFAFILGCVPLWTAAGAGAISRQVMGTAVIGGMLASSAIAIFVIPALFYIVEKLTHRKHAEVTLPPTQDLQPSPSK
jgi:HAE1 family hydrophobic/amphiphilic exporter-1